jgi:tRNA(Met) C34 N-acetyltransferase TmcA
MNAPGRRNNPRTGIARHRLQRFASLGLPQDTILPELDALIRSCGSSGRLHLLSTVHRELLVALVLQKKDSRELVDFLPVDGKRELEKLLRAAVSELLEVSETTRGVSH